MTLVVKCISPVHPTAAAIQSIRLPPWSREGHSHRWDCGWCDSGLKERLWDNSEDRLGTDNSAVDYLPRHVRLRTTDDHVVILIWLQGISQFWTISAHLLASPPISVTRSSYFYQGNNNVTGVAIASLCASFLIVMIWAVLYLLSSRAQYARLRSESRRVPCWSRTLACCYDFTFYVFFVSLESQE